MNTSRFRVAGAIGALFGAMLGSAIAIRILRRRAKPTLSHVPNRLEMLRIIWDLMSASRSSPDEIARRQRDRLQTLVDYARANSPYYKAHYQDVPTTIKDVRDLPPVSKIELRANFEDWVTDRAIRHVDATRHVSDLSKIAQNFLGRYVLFTSSGTTRTPTIFVQDSFSLVMYILISSLRSMPWLGGNRLWRVIRKGARITYLYATEGHFGGVVLVKRQTQVEPWRQRTVRILSVLAPVEKLVRDLNAFQPAVLSGYPTIFVVLARELSAGRLKISPVLLVAGGEHVDPVMRTEIETTFGCPVQDVYGASEAMSIAFECDHGWMHVSADWTILEPVDAQLRPVPAGQPSHTVLLSNLINRVQPIIRYDLSDSVTFKPEPCACGNQFPAMRVEGRTDDILTFTSAGGLQASILPLALGTVIEETPSVLSFQAIQEGPSALTIRLEAATGTDPDQVWTAVHGRVAEFLTSHGTVDVTITLASDAPARDRQTGKFRHVWKKFK